MIRALALLTATALFLGACTPWLPDYSDRDSGYRLVLHQSIRVPPERTRVFIQEGRVLPAQSFDQYDTSCNIEVRKLLPEEQTIEAGSFIVTQVHSLIEEVAQWQPQMLASLQLASAEVDSSPADIFMGWHFWLYSPTQPDVIRLTCRGEFSEPWNARPPTLQEITYALGEVATLTLPQQTEIKPGSY